MIIIPILTWGIKLGLPITHTLAFLGPGKSMEMVSLKGDYDLSSSQESLALYYIVSLHSTDY